MGVIAVEVDSGATRVVLHLRVGPGEGIRKLSLVFGKPTLPAIREKHVCRSPGT